MDKIESLNALHYDMGFLETLSALKKTELSKEKFGELLRKRMRDGMRGYVLIVDQKVVSTSSMYIEQKFYGLVAHIEDVATHEDHRRHGFGAKIMEHCFKIAREHGCYKVILDCNDKNVEWYSSLGLYRHENQMRKDLHNCLNECI